VAEFRRAESETAALLTEGLVRSGNMFGLGLLAEALLREPNADNRARMVLSFGAPSPFKEADRVKEAALTMLLSDEDKGVRLAVLGSLVSLRGEGASAALHAIALSDPSDEVRRQAATLLQSLASNK